MNFARIPTISKKQVVETGVVAALVLLFAALNTGQNIYTQIAIAVLLVSLVAPVLIKPVAIVWFGLAQILGSVSSKIILGLIFFLIVSPVALIRKAMKKDRLWLKSFKQDEGSAYRTRNHKFIPDDFKHQF